MMRGIPQTFNGKPRKFVWEYKGESGDPLGYVARFDDGGKKDIVPYFKRVNGHDWASGGATEPRPLYGLDVLKRASDKSAIFIVEGEKAAAALQSLGLIAVTSQGGCKAADKTNWEPLEGCQRVFLLPDNGRARRELCKGCHCRYIRICQAAEIVCCAFAGIATFGRHRGLDCGVYK